MAESKKHILAISGSTKKKSSNEAIIRFIADYFKNEINVELFDGIDTLPHFNPELDQEEPPVVVVNFREKIQKADGILICTPEYVFSLPGSLKNALEWNVSTTNFSNKPTAIIVAAASGEKALESLALIMTTIEARLPEESRLLIKGVKGKVSATGTIQDQATISQIEVLMESFLRTMRATDEVPTKYQV
ncbi:NADPH-dependent FMN reductase [Adhaeribacter pallidiroseus]|uniref:NAD(P)H:quinone oxidoreductase n=1 Tax=Adhaeribacter pallidiroseus TaxID=2072847 RepID=A0A369QJ93_9BACT|nr:NAD(P)H-dependent oxidoreductase [Adhaeribacter pallidiroseus]RDC64981.1 NAD(P)H:quinone oxidoreductase [Adhaeribacter pallidiroseus]